MSKDSWHFAFEKVALVKSSEEAEAVIQYLQNERGLRRDKSFFVLEGLSVNDGEAWSSDRNRWSELHIMSTVEHNNIPTDVEERLRREVAIFLRGWRQAQARAAAQREADFQRNGSVLVKLLRDFLR